MAIDRQHAGIAIWVPIIILVAMYRLGQYSTNIEPQNILRTDIAPYHSFDFCVVCPDGSVNTKDQVRDEEPNNER
jgi:hypothetical protein